MENTYGIVFMILILSSIAWVTSHTKYLEVSRRLNNIEKMPKVSRGEFDLLKDQFIAYQKSKMRIASECDIAVGVLLWKEYDTGMDWTRVSEGRVGNEDLDVGEFIGDVSAPGGPRRYNIYNGPWYIEKERHGKEGR